MPEVLLSACRAEPLGSYLKALGLLRLVGEQVDPDASGRWNGSVFELRSTLDLEGLVDFLVDRYEPTPIVTPWNNGSGFAPDDATKSRTAFDAVSLLASNTDPRLAGYRATVETARRLAAAPEWGSLTKEQQVARCRNALPDDALPWVDAAIVITSERCQFPPLLGTGGNDGRLDFGSNVMQRIADAFELGSKRKRSGQRGGARAALVREGSVQLDVAKMGQFDPAAAGGPRTDPFGDAPSIGSTWDYLLMFEGSLLLASGVARRLSGGPSTTSAPFILPALAAGFGSAAAESSRGEFWAPLWSRYATYAEMRRLLGEGRVEYNGRQARTALDMARGVAAYGADRGLDAFIRYGFIERNGLSTFAVPIGRHRVDRITRSSAIVLGRVDSWLGRVRSVSNPPASLVSRLRRADELQFAVCAADDADRAAAAQHLLSQVAEIERLASRSRAIRERTGPVTGLSAVAWVPLVDDGSPEFDVAVALASMRRPTTQGQGAPTAGVLRQLLSDLEWRGSGPVVDGFTTRPLVDVLADCVNRLLIDRHQVDEPDAGCFGRLHATWAPLSSVGALLNGTIDLDRAEHVLGGLLLLDWSQYRDGGRRDGEATEPRAAIRLPIAYSILKATMHHESLPDDDAPLRAAPEWIRRARAGRPADAIELAMRALRVHGRALVVHTPSAIASGVDPDLLAAACLIPISSWSMNHLLSRISQPVDPVPSLATPEEAT